MVPSDRIGHLHPLSPLPKDLHPVYVPAQQGYWGARPLLPGRLETRASRVTDSLRHPKGQHGDRKRLTPDVQFPNCQMAMRVRGSMMAAGSWGAGISS